MLNFKNKFLSIYNASQKLLYKDTLKVPEQSLVADMIPLLSLCENKAIINTKENNFVAVIKLSSNSSMSDSHYQDQMYNLRSKLLKLITPAFTAQIHTRRELIDNKKSYDYTNTTAKEIGTIWEKNFDKIYDTTHYLVLRTVQPNLLDKTVGKVENETPQKDLETLLTNLYAQGVEFNPEILSGGDLISFWATITTAKRTVKIETEKDFDDYINTADILFPKNKNYIIFDDGTQKKYASILCPKEYPQTLQEKIFASLCTAEIEFNIYQTLIKHTKIDSLNRLNFKNNIYSKAKFSSTSAEETKALITDIESEEIELIKHGLQIMIFGNSLDELNTNTTLAKTHLERQSLSVIRESLGLQACFWSIFPEYETYRVRTFNITSENAPHFVALQNFGGGLNQCSFGSGATARFKTIQGASYGFTFHPTPQNQANGNTLIVGGSGMGKTTLVSFLLANCFKYDNFKAICFDRRKGLNIFTEFMNGDFIDFASGVNLNPLHLGKNHKIWLTQYISKLTGATDDKAITQALNQVLTLNKTDRSLSELYTALGQPVDGSVAQGLEQWLPNGSLGYLLNGKADSLNFDKDIITFDTTTLLDIPKALGAVSDYIFYKLTQEVLTHPRPHAIFIDEINKYLDSDIFAPRLKELSAEVRKMNGITLMAVQSPKTFFNNATGREMNENIATYIIFGNPSALEQGSGDSLGNYEIYTQSLGLNDTELAWVAQGNTREVLIKRKDGDSVILDVNLASLGKWLKIFNSDTDAVKKMKDLQKTASNWKQEFLGE